MRVKRWKQRIVPLFLMAVMVVSAALTGMPSQVKAAEPESDARGWLESAGASGQYVAVSGGSSSAGAALITWGGKEENQEWGFKETAKDSGIYQIINIKSSMAIAASDTNAGSTLIQTNQNAEDKYQLWSFVEEAAGTYRIKNQASRLYLAAAGTDQGVSVIQDAKDTASDLQLWKTDAVLNTVTDTEDVTVSVWRKDGIIVTAESGVVTKGESVEITLAPIDGYRVENIGLRIFDADTLDYGERADEATYKDVEVTAQDDGTYTYTAENLDKDIVVQAQADVVTDAYDAENDMSYIYIPEDNYSGRNQCLSPRVVEDADGNLYATFENGNPSELVYGEYSFPVYKSADKGKTWVRISEIVNDDNIHPDEAIIPNQLDDYSSNFKPGNTPVDQPVDCSWSLQNCPQLFILPEDAGSLKAGTILCMGNAVALEKGASKIADNGSGGLYKTSLDLYYSTDNGETWDYLSTVADGGINIMGYDPVWEPFFVYYEGDLICYYSDETDPDHNQKLVYKISKDGGATWEKELGSVVELDNAGERPGMPVVTQMANGQWMMVYETVGRAGGTRPGYKIADDPYNWNSSDPGSTIPGTGGCPYIYTMTDGRTIAGSGDVSGLYINTKEDGTGAWVIYETGAPSCYNRCFFQLSTEEFLICGTEGPQFASNGNKIYVKLLDIDEDFAEDEDLTASQSVKNKESGQVLGVWQGSSAAGSEVVTWSFGQNSYDQMWIPAANEDGTYALKNYSSGKVITVDEDGNITQEEQADAGTDAAKKQSFAIEAVGTDGYYTIKSVSANAYLTYGEAKDGGYDVVLTDEADDDACLWSFARISDLGEDFKPDGGDQPEAPILNEIKVTTKPVKTEYKIGEKLDLSGIAVAAYYEGGDVVMLEEGEYTVTGFDSAAAGEKTITVSYQGKTATFTVTVKADSTEPGGDDGKDPSQPGGDDGKDPVQPGGDDSQNTDNGGQGTDNSGNNKTDNDSQSGAPQTGDTTPLGMYTILLLACAAVSALVLNSRMGKNRR